MTAYVCQLPHQRRRVLRTCALLLTLATFALLLPIGTYAATVTLEWDPPSQDSDVVSGYLLYYGEVSGPPYEGEGVNEGQSPIDVGDVTTFTVTGLDDTRSYFFAVTAYNEEGLESDYSNEAATNDNEVPTNPPVTDSGNGGGSTLGTVGGCFINTAKRNQTNGVAGSVILGVFGAVVLGLLGGSKIRNKGRNRA
jgi:Fibronectin type III domain